MRTVETKLFAFNELSESAKAVARDWFRENVEFSYWAVIEDAKAIGALFGFDIDHVFYSGFYSQGDGACFIGSAGYGKQCAKAVKSYAPKDKTLHALVKRWQDLQRRHFYRLTATINHNERYYHANSVDIELDQNINADDESEFCDILRDFMDWIYSRLEKEYSYQRSDEYINEAILTYENEYTEDGKPV